MSWFVPVVAHESLQARHMRERLTEALVHRGAKVDGDKPGVVVDLEPASRFGAAFDDTLLVLSRSQGDGISSNPIGLVCTSAFTAKAIIDHGTDLPTTVIGPGLDDWLRGPAVDAREISTRGFAFLCVVEDDDSMDLLGLVESFAYVFDAKSDVTLVIAGRREGLPAIQRSVEEKLDTLEASPHVLVIPGACEPAVLKGLYAQCDVLVSPHRTCGFNLSIAYAFLSDMPVIATAMGGHRTYCDDTNSWPIDYRVRKAARGKAHSGAIEAVPKASALDALLHEVSNLPREALRERARHGSDRLVSTLTWDQFADRLVTFAEHCLAAKPVRRQQKVAWITTWNTQCGIADHSSYMIEPVESGSVVVFAPKEPPVRTDQRFCSRVWILNKDNNDFGPLYPRLDSGEIGAVNIQFNYAFYNHQQLAALIEHCVRRKIVVIVELHSTVDPVIDKAGFSLRELASAFQKCDRVIVHGIGDVERLKAIGLTENVTMMPMGTPAPAQRPKHVPIAPVPTLSTYGFCLPNKGLPEVVEAVGLLKQRGRHVRLRMFNAEHPDPVSAKIKWAVTQAISKHDVGDRVEFDTRYLDADTSMQLLSEADLIINSYQVTGESASASVRNAISTGVPVAVTPLAIFDDLGDVVFRLPGISPRDMADGIETVLSHLSARTEEALKVEAEAKAWIDQLSYKSVGARMHALTLALMSNPVPTE